MPDNIEPGVAGLWSFLQNSSGFFFSWIVSFNLIYFWQNLNKLEQKHIYLCLCETKQTVNFYQSLSQFWYNPITA